MAARLVAAAMLLAVSLAASFPHAAGQSPRGIYLTDPGNGRIVRLADLTGAGWTTLSMQSAPPGTGRQFAFQSGIVVDGSGRIYFSDVTNSRIVRVDNITGAGWVTFGSRGTGRNQFDLPAGISVDATGRIYIADASNSRIVAYQ